MKKFLILFSLLTFMLVVGCSNSSKEVLNHDEIDLEKTNKEFDTVVESEEIEEPEEVETSLDHTYPLTGLATEEETNQRIVSVMINNHPAARPQSGLSQADIVIEVLAEWNITRFLALFQSETPETVGPVRSAREYYFELANGYDALYVFHGAAGFVKDMIIQRDYDYLDGAIYDNDQNLFKRESFRKAPHNSYLLFGGVDEVAESKGYDIIRNIEALPFLNQDADTQGQDANHIKITYPGRSVNDSVEYKYQEKEETYTRFEREEQTREFNTEVPIEIENVFIVETPHEIIDDEGRRSVDTESGGSALLMQKGKVQEVEWMNRNGQIIPVQDGEPIGFIKGKTWINIVPSNPGIGQIVIVSNE